MPIARGPAAALLVAVGVPAAILGAASLPWHGERPSEPPRVVAASRCAGPLSAGAAQVPFDLPAPVSIAGFARLSWRSEGTREPVAARALVLSAPGCKIALVSAEVLLVPEPLEAAVRARISGVGLTGLVLAATHTHAGPGGYLQNAFFEALATGPYDPAARDAVAGAIAEAIRRADAALAPARLAFAAGEAPGLARSRSGGASESRLAVLRIDRPGKGNAPVAEVAVFAAHATIVGSSNRRIDGDWPARFMASDAHGTRLLFQGAVGDQSAAGAAASSPEAYARALSERVDGMRFGSPATDAPLAYAAAEVALPAPDPAVVPRFLRRAARNVAWGSLPAHARVSAVRLGPVLLVAVPAEPAAAAASSWRGLVPGIAVVVSLADGYAGYVETADHVAARSGEARRTYYGPDLAMRLGDGVRAAADAAMGRWHH